MTATAPALFAAVVGAFFAGWHFHKLKYATSDLQSARNRLAGALRAVWRARWWAAFAVVVVWVLAHKWINGTG